MTDGGMRGAEVARLFHEELVGPLVERAFPGLRYAAGRLGSGSDALGVDDKRSQDHDWGCRLTLLLDITDNAQVPRVRDLLERQLPQEFRGLPVRFGVTWDPAATHNVWVATVGSFAVSRLGVDPLAGLSVLDWLILTGQGVLEVTAGPVFADTTTQLGPLRAALTWYPPDVERYILAAGWQRLERELPMHGRAAEAGDETGSRLIAARLADAVMRLAFILERRWLPYRKWQGTLFGSLPLAGRLRGRLATVVSADGWRQREDAIAAAADELLAAQRSRGLPAPPTATAGFFGRPFRTIHESMQPGLLAEVTDPEVRRLPPGIGSIEQWTDSHSIQESPGYRGALLAAYRELLS